MIATTFVNMAISTAILRDQGVLKRMQGTPLPRWAYVAARIGSTLVIVLLMTAITLALGVGAYGVHLRGSTIPGLLVTLVLGTAAFTSLGIGVTRLIPNAEAAPVVVNLLILPLTFISSIWFPTDGMPEGADRHRQDLPDPGARRRAAARVRSADHQAPASTAGPADTGDLDGGRDLPDAAVPAPAAGRGAMTADATRARRGRRRGAPRTPVSTASAGIRWTRATRTRYGRGGDRVAGVHRLPARQRDRHDSGTPLERVLEIAGAAAFVAAYVLLVMHWRNQPRAPTPLLLFALDAGGFGGADDLAGVGLGLPVHVLRRAARRS